VVDNAGLRGQIYLLPENTNELPNFKKLKPVGSIYTTKLKFLPQLPGGLPRHHQPVRMVRHRLYRQVLDREAGKYQFALLSDDGSKLYIDGRKVIDNDGLHPSQALFGSVTLSGGVHSIRISYFQGPGRVVPDAPDSGTGRRSIPRLRHARIPSSERRGSREGRQVASGARPEASRLRRVYDDSFASTTGKGGSAHGKSPGILGDGRGCGGLMAGAAVPRRLKPRNRPVGRPARGQHSRGLHGIARRVAEARFRCARRGGQVREAPGGGGPEAGRCQLHRARADRNTPDAASKAAANNGDADAILIVHLAFGSGAPMLKFVDTGKPVAIFSQPFSGHDWMYVPQWQQQGKRVVNLSFERLRRPGRAAALLRVPARMRQSKIVLIGPAAGRNPRARPRRWPSASGSRGSGNGATNRGSTRRGGHAGRAGRSGTALDQGR